MSVLGTLGNFAFGTQDWKNAWHEASQGHWGEAAKDAGWGALALGSTAALAVPVLGEGVKGAAMAAEAAHLATAGRAAEGVMGAARAAETGINAGKATMATSRTSPFLSEITQTGTRASRPSVEAYAQGTARDLLSESYGVGTRSAGRSLSRAADQTAYEFPDSVAAGRSPVATITRPKIEPIRIPQPKPARPVGPNSPKWTPEGPAYVPEGPAPLPKEFPGRNWKPEATPEAMPEAVPGEATTLPESVAPGPGTTLMPKNKILTEEGAATETQLQPKLGPNGRPVPVGVVAPVGGTETPGNTPTKPGAKPKRPRKKGRNDSIWLQVPGQDIEQQVVH